MKGAIQLIARAFFMQPDNDQNYEGVQEQEVEG